MTYKLTTKEILQQNLSRRPPAQLAQVKVVLHNIRSLYNVGSVFRSCDAFGISEILLSGYTPAPPRAEITKTAIGAEEFVNWQYRDDPQEMIKELKQSGYVLFGLEQTTDSIPLTRFAPHSYEKLCFVLGNEVTGIDDELLPHLDGFIDIPQFGHKHSLNVSVAAAVLLYALLEKLSTG